jgi:hypothetical protein
MFKLKEVGIGLAVVLLSHEAAAEDGLIMPEDMSLSIGAGVTGFTDSNMRDYANVGGSWEARLTAGTRSTLAVEAAYVGSAQSIDALGLDNNAILVGNGAEGLARVNLTKSGVQPFIVAGVGWTRYDTTNADVNTSAVSSKDNVFQIPLGLGVGYRYDKFIFDARAMFRPSFDNDLVAKQTGGSTTRLDSLTGMIHGGFEF